MKNVSNEFRKTMNTRTDFYMESDVVFADGTEKELTRENFYLSGNSYTDAAGNSSFPLGVALEKQIQISLVNDKDQFSEYDFYGAKFTVYCCLDLDSGTTEKILLGTFTVTEPETYGSIITVTAVDDMYKGDKDYSTGLTFPMTAGQALRDSCSACGITLLDTTFTNDDYIISEMPEGITHRALWGLCAMLAGGNARMDEYNRLRIISYDFSLFDRAGLNGGVFDNDNPYSSGDTADGGSFNPWDTGAAIDGGTFLEAKDYHVFWKAKNLTVATDDVVITGVQTTIDEETYRFGEEGYILSLTNQLIEGNPQDAVNRIGALIVGARFRPLNMDHTAYPLAEVGDVCFVVDRKQNTYQAIVTDVNFTFFGFTTLQCKADSPIRNSSKYNSQLTQAIVQARLNTQKQITEYDKAVQQLTSLITQSFGVYKTEEVLEDGSTIYYMHNKLTLAESQTIWKMTADAFAVSTDGGQTWNAGMDSSGNAVVNVLSTVGINFNWAKGGTLTLGGQGNGNGVCRVLDTNENVVAELNSDGVNIKKGRISVEAEDLGYKALNISYNPETPGTINQNVRVFADPTGFTVRTHGEYYGGGEVILETSIAGGDITLSSYSGGTVDNPDYATHFAAVSISMIEKEKAQIVVTGNVSVGGNFTVFNGTKNRAVETENYGTRLLNAYETATPYFGDIGTNIIPPERICWVEIDPIFAETVSLDNYVVFLQAEGPGECYIGEKRRDRFAVLGTPGLRFAYEIKAKQKGFEHVRLDEYKEKEVK